MGASPQTPDTASWRKERAKAASDSGVAAAVAGDPQSHPSSRSAGLGAASAGRREASRA